jgi:uncharacterized membrane protein
MPPPPLFFNLCLCFFLTRQFSTTPSTSTSAAPGSTHHGSHGCGALTFTSILGILVLVIIVLVIFVIFVSFVGSSSTSGGDDGGRGSNVRDHCRTSLGSGEKNKKQRR